MTIRKSNLVVNAEANAFSTLMSGGSIEFYTGDQPATADDSTSETLVGTATLNTPAFDAAVDGVSIGILIPLVSGVAVAAGVIGWARYKTSGGGTVMDVSASEQGGGGDILLENDTMEIGEPIRLLILNYTIPKE